MKWIEVQIKTNSENEDIVSNILYNAGATGLAIEDPNDILEFSRTEKNWDFIDASLIDQNIEGIIIKAYFSHDEKFNETINSIKSNILSNSLGEVYTNEVDDNDWAENWKKYYKPIRIGSTIVIKPSWESFEEEEGDLIIELDPGMAFGTGTHETTILCTEALDKYVSNDSKVFDIGCGSGILSIVAAKLGAREVKAIDLDEVCIKVSNENIIINNVNDIVEVKHGNLLDVIEGKADIIVANIIAEIIVEMTKDLKSYLEPEGKFIASGIILEKITKVEEALLENGFKIIEINRMNSWASIVATIN